MGKAVVLQYPQIISTLIETLGRKRGNSLRETVAEALGDMDMGEQAAQYPQMIHTLLSVLNSQYERERESAAEALSKIIRSGLRIFVIDQIRWVSELAKLE